MLRSFVFVLLALTACYRTNAATDHCNLSCSGPADCPNGLLCNDDKLCSIVGQKCLPADDGSLIDTLQIDPDATSPCAGSAGGLVGEICFASVPTPSLIDPIDSVDTDNDVRCDAISTQFCLLVVADFSTNLRATGSRPLILWSSNTITMSGAIDVASHRGELTQGSGARPCVAGGVGGNGGNGMGSSPSAGGAGGGFGTPAGKGGTAGFAGGGIAGAVEPTPTTLRGGCPGGSGGGPNPTGPAQGGGAVYLMAATRIIMSGRINASGAGANAPTSSGGGGGGGSGGLIGFEAPNIDLLTGSISIALGGGGSSGGFLGTAPGLPGDEPSFTDPYFSSIVTGPVNPCLTNTGGQSGTGSTGPSAGMAGGGGNNTQCSGGGGGGGSGFILGFGEVSPGTAITRPALL